MKELKISKSDVEGRVYKYLIEKGYSVALGKWYGEAGVPDFYVYDGNKREFWVEVKRVPTDALSLKQIRWICGHPTEEVYIVLVDDKAVINFHKISFVQKEIIATG